MNELNVAFACDYAEEGWPSMDLVAAMLPQAVEDLGEGNLRVERLQPRAPRRLRRLASDRWPAAIGDRLLNRYFHYPRWVRRQAAGHRVFHVLDHTYAHLVHVLPPQRTIVTCHDLDAFRCVLEPGRAPRPWLFRRLVRRTLRGLQLAAKIACVSQAVCDELVAAGIAARSRTVIVPNGVHPAFRSLPDETSDTEAARLVGGRGAENRLDLLHVGIPIPRKRIDRALEVLASVRRTNASARLIRVGGALPSDLRALATRLGVDDHVVELPFLSPGILAAVYRRASVVLLPSDAEGFGLPILEALACGTPVLANDLPVLRETGGGVTRYRDNSDITGWCSEVLAVAAQPREELQHWRSAACIHAARFTWRAAAERLLPLYLELNAR